MLTKADKIDIAKLQVKELKRQLLSCCDARVSCEMAMEFIGDMERMLKS